MPVRFFISCEILYATMYRHPETNPHFIRPLQQQRQGRSPQTPPSPGVPQQSHLGQQDQPASSHVTLPQSQGQRPKPQSEGKRPKPPPKGQVKHPRSQDEWVGQPQREGQFYTPWLPEVPHQDQQPQREGQFYTPWLPPVPHQDQQPRREGKPSVPHQDQRQTLQPQQHEGQLPISWLTPRQQDRRPQGPQLPRSRPTKPITWFAAVICAIFWTVIFLGGLIVLIVYLVYRPRSPQFDVSSATLNAAYIDTGSLLNADLSVLANFTNPNKKMNVDYSSMIIDLYYGNTLIATQSIEPFSAEKAESRLANVHMITSQVRLPLLESQRLQEQIERNQIIFDVEGVFRVRSNLGMLRYSYWLYGHCNIMVTSPPTGVLRANKCRTKH